MIYIIAYLTIDLHRGRIESSVFSALHDINDKNIMQRDGVIHILNDEAPNESRNCQTLIVLQ